ncbi:MAG: hypothetical protein WAM70_09425 [Pyrinomonadaceae bacterium]
MPFAHLKRERIREIKQAFEDAGKIYDEDLRTLMLDRTGYGANLKHFKTPFYQLSGDISALNSIEFVADAARTVPFKAWLENGKEYFTPLTQAKVFEEALGELLAGPAESASAEVIVGGLAALSELIEQDDFAHDAVFFYRRIFETAIKEFEIIADYKRMHDALHKLQLGWPDISSMLNNLAMTSTIHVMILNSLTLLTGTIADLDDTFERKFVDGAEKKWMNNLKQERISLEKAIEDDQMSMIEITFNDIKEQLGSDLSWLNSRLKTAVTSVHLKDLINSMGDLCIVLQDVASERASRQVERYAAGVSEIAKLDEELSKLIIQHDEWQRNEDILRVLSVALRQQTNVEGERSTSTEAKRLSQLELISTVVNLSVVPLLAGQTSTLAKRLNISVQKLDDLIEQKDADKAEILFFFSYLDQARLFFFDLDTGLKAKCEELRRIGHELQQVNSELVATPLGV